MAGTGSAGMPGADGGVTSFTNVKAAPAAPTLLARSVTRAVIDFAPSEPMSAVETIKSTNMSERFRADSTCVFGVANDAPPLRSSSVSPTTAPEPARLTRSTVEVAVSASDIHPSVVNLSEPRSDGLPGDDGAATSLINDSDPLTAPMLPDWSITRDAMVLAPSAPRSAAEIAKETDPARMSRSVRETILGVLNGAPPRSSSIESFARTVASKTTLTTMPPEASVALRYPSVETFCGSNSVGFASAVGIAVSFSKTSGMLAALTFPTLSVMSADRLLKPSTPRFACVIRKST